MIHQKLLKYADLIRNISWAASILKTVVLLNIFCVNHNLLKDFLMNRVQNNNLFEKEMFVANVFTVIYDQFNPE